MSEFSSSSSASQCGIELSAAAQGRRNMEKLSLPQSCHAPPVTSPTPTRKPRPPPSRTLPAFSALPREEQQRCCCCCCRLTACHETAPLEDSTCVRTHTLTNKQEIQTDGNTSKVPIAPTYACSTCCCMRVRTLVRVCAFGGFLLAFATKGLRGRGGHCADRQALA